MGAGGSIADLLGATSPQRGTHHVSAQGGPVPQSALPRWTPALDDRGRGRESLPADRTVRLLPWHRQDPEDGVCVLPRVSDGDPHGRATALGKSWTRWTYRDLRRWDPRRLGPGQHRAPAHQLAQD